MKKRAAFILGLLLSSSAFAQEIIPTETRPFAAELEGGIIHIRGNAEVENYSVRGVASYLQEKNRYSLYGRYIQSQDDGVESSRNWSTGLRYDFELTNRWGIFAGYKYEGDRFAGFFQRDSTDIGLRYYFIRNDDTSWAGEVGYRYSHVFYILEPSSYDSLVRLYTAYLQNTENRNVAWGIWLEYLPIVSSDTNWQANGEAFVTMMFNQVFALKISYLAMFQDSPAETVERMEKTFQTTLLARF
ncbi:DUF481 domain-containing protein [Bdellovibrio sp. 22V]|uniref:DUF481 domain-containing protein n=1 Tax=Bdellovibrio TaxID=958 RepID=UPI002543E425|nr:DUF481 domain-containing protein [Bdellovibrio sp. 22V]WII71340.1 DUF481 domain-containing protein [Bdellovibrio sp. 22V]